MERNKQKEMIGRTRADKRLYLLLSYVDSFFQQHSLKLSIGEAVNIRANKREPERGLFEV